MLPSSRRKLFRLSITDQLRAAAQLLPWAPPVGPGMKDDAFFRTYGNRVADEHAPDVDPNFRDYGAILPVSVAEEPIDRTTAISFELPFVIVSGGANTRRSVASSQPIFGPAILDSIWARFTSSAGISSQFNIFISETNDNIDNVRPSGRPTFGETLKSSGVIAFAEPDGLFIPDQAENLMFERFVNQRINLARFFFKAMVSQAAVAGSVTVQGMAKFLVRGADQFTPGTRATRRQPQL